MSLLEQDTTRKGRVDENAMELAKLDAGKDNSEYKVEAIRDSAVYTRESAVHLPGLYYLVSWKGYPEEENTWEPALAVQQLKKLISSFHKGHPDKPTATFETIDTAPPMVRPTIKPTARPTAPKQKQGRPAGKSTNKRAKKNWAAFDFYRIFSSFEVRVIKTLNLEVTWFPNQPTYQNFIHQISILRASTSIFETDPPQLQLYAQGVGFPPHYSCWVRKFFIDDLSTYIVNNFSVFLLSSHWVKRFFIDWSGWFSFLVFLLG